VVLGGVRIAHTRGILAHSDGDVLLHALVDALLGAASLGDIGQHFPDSDPQWKGANSERFVAAAMEMLTRRGLKVVNADLTLLAQAPKISLWRDEIRRNIARLVALPEACVNLKATTTEHLGFIGRNEGLMAMATVLIDEIKPD
jgi:2-C-methyl-D-erythritol 2,4-cyclodiphosphate synthase